MSKHPGRTARVLATLFFMTTVALSVALVLSWKFFYKLALRPLPEPDLPSYAHPSDEPVSPLQVHYQLDLPGRGEIFPALSGSQAADYWPVAVLSISNTAARPVLQVISAQVHGWTTELRQTVVIGPHETRSLRLEPELLPEAFANSEFRRATLAVEAQDATTGYVFAQQRPVFLHSASDLFWGNKFANAQLLARWVTPHDEAVLQLVSRAERLMPGGRLRGYNPVPRIPMEAQVREQAAAVFAAMKESRISYVSSIYTFGNFPGETERIRLPRETLHLSNANCIDVSVAFASAMENLGMQPVIVIVPGHAFTGVRLAPDSQNILYVDLTVLPKGSFNQAISRAEAWMKKTPAAEVLTVDVGAARSLGIYPLPTPQQPATSATS
ncbi:MAG TPA: hypothetical protein VKD65_15440 [Candidatus Angelobacter sp.]|nr:hypothetical protein [Candidatus Angelobacter sp.]